ncbi:MAG TPA: hypothetical protein PKE37_15000 [Thiomonas arsenitoxydans]|uniref:hypothetical protein n=1 Tax=Thiomonas arsenitoxydans (strain DSM 22701 / CIP 110005 / 3As) TaxID=426114 RepID=UPI002C33881C|nr:hypothetical protein [Thiomonas arsenitoxydans]HML83063.1 hypothetical protein [Thiomonas arsenitoxydans]
MAVAIKHQDFSEQLARGVHNWGTHTYKVMLSNTAPLATNSVKADLTEIAAGNGYTAGGTETTITVSETGGTTTISGTEVVFTATGAVGPFRYATVYNDTAPSDNLVQSYDYGSAVTLAAGETFAVRFNDASPGTILTIA